MSHCARVLQVKGLFKELNVDFKLFELDQMGEEELALQLWRVLLSAQHTCFAMCFYSTVI